MQVIQALPCAFGRPIARVGLFFLLTVCAASVPAWSQAQSSSTPSAFTPTLVNTSTIPSNGDVNPYGVAFVPAGFPTDGSIAPGDVLVSNFNNKANLQGTGTTIIQFTPTKTVQPPNSATVLFTSTQPGLTTALAVLKEGFVLVGNVPTTDGTVGTIGQGALQVIDRHGKMLQTLTDATFLNGPWDLAINDNPSSTNIFVSNVLNGTVTRLDVAMTSSNVTIVKKTTIATGYVHMPNQSALVVGPTGLAYDPTADTLYVASTGDNAIFAVTNATHATNSVNRGTVAFSDPHLRGPLALRFAPNGNLLTANGDAVAADPTHPSEIIEFTKQGQFVASYNVDPSPGAAFGLDAVTTGTSTSAPFNYAAINDVTNTLSVFGLPTPTQ